MSTNPSTLPITIVGAGLGGSLMAMYLAREGYPVTVYERRSDMRKGPMERGRSINLALSARGLHALEEVGMASAVVNEMAIPMKGRLIHAVDGTLTFQQYGRHAEEVNYSVSRTGLNIALINAAERLPNVKFHFNRRCLGLNPDAGHLTLASDDHTAPTDIAANVVIGADGAFSAVRQQLQKRDRFDFQQEYLDWGYKELTIPAGPGGSFQIEQHALHIWPRHDYMLIALPNLDGSFTCTLFFPFEGPDSFASVRTESEITAFFQRVFPDAVPLMPHLVDDYLHNPSSSLVTIRCFPWHVDGRVALLGDACHAVVPFYGQGMNASFEDCSVLHHCLKRHRGDFSRAFQDYETLRKRNADALGDLSKQNFVEMRSKVASKTFLLRKRVEKWLNHLFPDRFIPLYNMVTHTLIPYADALARARRQDRWLDLAGYGALAFLAWFLLQLVIR